MGGEEKEGDNAETPLARLMGRGNRLRLLQLLALEDEREHACQEERHDGEGGCPCRCRAPSSGGCPCEEKKKEWGGADGGGPSNNDHDNNQCNDWASLSPLLGGGRMSWPPSPVRTRPHLTTIPTSPMEQRKCLGKGGSAGTRHSCLGSML